jgi:peroxiredoxin
MRLGNSINLGELKGKKVMLSFYHFAGYPICNFRFHEIETNMLFFESNNIVVIGVYESSPVAMKTFIEGENFKTTLIPNPTFEFI